MGGPIAVVRLDVTPDQVELGDCPQQVVQVAAYDDRDRPVAGLVISLSSSNASVVTVTGSGQLTARGPGSATLRVTAGSLSDSAAAMVSDSATTQLLTHLTDIAIGGKDMLLVSFNAAGTRAVVANEAGWGDHIY